MKTVRFFCLKIFNMAVKPHTPKVFGQGVPNQSGTPSCRQLVLGEYLVVVPAVRRSERFQFLLNFFLFNNAGFFLPNFFYLAVYLYLV